MKLLVSGCSITHGAELYNNFMHPENIKKSYSAHLAKILDVDLINVAMSAASNEYIFHSLLEEIKKNNDLHSVIVMWTTPGRLYWKKKNRHYFIHAGHATSVENLVDFKMHDKMVHDSWIVSDHPQVLENLVAHHRFFVTDYFDDEKELEKLKNYKMALESVCLTKKIKLVQLSWENISHVGSWRKEQRHPNADEHKIIADLIYETYYDNKQ